MKSEISESRGDFVKKGHDFGFITDTFLTHNFRLPLLLQQTGKSVQNVTKCFANKIKADRYNMWITFN